MGKPAHDNPVAFENLLTVDTEILAGFVRPLRDHKGPGDEGPGVTRPACLYRKAAEIDLAPFEPFRLATCVTHGLGGHGEELLENRQLSPSLRDTLGRLGLSQESEQLTNFAERLHRIFPHAECDAPGGAEEVAEHRDGAALGLLEQQRWSATPQCAVADLRYLKAWIHRHVDSLELALCFELLQEISQVAVDHGWSNSA